MSIRTKISCLIIEDEPMAQNLLMDFVEQIPSLSLVGVASNAQQALQLCQDKKPELLLLDIRMPRFSGFDLLELLPKPVPIVIITTANRKYALQGYEHAVIDFLLKPFEFARFSESIRRVEERLNVDRSHFITLQEEISLEHAPKTLTIRKNSINEDIPFDTINYVESYDNYVKIHLINPQSKYVMYKVPLSKLVEVLPGNEFMRINRRYVIRLDQLLEFNGTIAKLSAGQELAVGVTYQDSLKETLQNPGTPTFPLHNVRN